jgi:MerR family transcriptional regulator, thiopeptide resistance regulator
MTPAADHTYRTAAFAALAGVTSRALHHYDRLGLLTPKRSGAGYRMYSERDLETLEEIVALKFIGIPLKKIAAIRRRSSGSFVDILHAQREALEARRSTLTRAIAAVAAAETALRSGSAIDAELFRHIIQVMHMDANHEDTVERYSAMLRAKASHTSALSAEQRAALQQQWSELVDEVKAALDEDPGSPKAQSLLHRWVSLLQALTGTDATKFIEPGSDATPFRATPEIRDALWARRAEWLPGDAEREARELTDAEEALAQVREQIQSFADSGVLEFITRARAARG